MTATTSLRDLIDRVRALAQTMHAPRCPDEREMRHSALALAQECARLLDEQDRIEASFHAYPIDTPRRKDSVMPELHHAGRVAYAAYCQSLGSTVVAWEHLPPETQDAWQAAAIAVRDDGVVICGRCQQELATPPKSA